ncbi:MAG: AMP-binding protein [Pseudomonadota bacterium]
MDYFDEHETRAPEAREAALFKALRAQLRDAFETAPGLAAHLGTLDVEALTDRAALARLPVLRKADLTERQRQDPPFGGLTTREAASFAHIFQSPGPIYEPGMDTPDWWRFGRALYAAGIRAGMVVHNAFAYHLTPAGHMLESGARALGASVIAGGVGNTEAQVRAAADLGARAYVGTPDFLRLMLEKADELGLSLTFDRALVSGGPLFPSLRQTYADRGIACLQCYGTADVGLIAYETRGGTGGPDGAPNPGMTIDEGVIVEIVRPGTGDPVPEGDVGEVLVSALNPDYPLVRFATGDLSAILAGASPCGRTGQRIKGWMGRADQTAKVRGMFVRPEQIAAVLARHPDAAKARLTITRTDEQDAMVLAVEAEGAPENLPRALSDSLRDVLKLRAEVEIVAPATLPNDGKVIDDQRSFD